MSYGLTVNDFHFSKKKTYTIEFDVHTSTYIPKDKMYYTCNDVQFKNTIISEEDREDLLEKLKADYGTGPFTRAKIKSNFYKSQQHYNYG